MAHAQKVGKRVHALLTLTMAVVSGASYADSTTTSEKDYALPKCATSRWPPSWLAN